MFAAIYAPGNLDLLLECARRFSPHIETQGTDLVVFDVRGLERLHGSAVSIAAEIERVVGVHANVAIASNPDAAIHAARGFSGITVVEPGREGERLAPLSINLLGASAAPVSAETAELLHLWGVRTFGDFARLPPLGVAARLGEDGSHLQRLAQGDGYRRLQPVEEPLEFEQEMELEHPVELLEPLSFIVSRLLNDVCGRLRFRALATNDLQLRLSLENAPDHHASLRLPVPMLEPRSFLKMLQLDLSRRPPAAPVWKVHLRADPVKPRQTQHGLFLPSSPEPEKMEVTVARLRHILGENAVGSPRIRDTHRPDSFEIGSFAPPPPAITEAPVEGTPLLCLRRYRPPRYAQVLLIHDEPVRVASSTVNGRVVIAKGPWRTSGGWWQTVEEGNWNREEWDVALESGELYRLSRDLDTGRWFIEGSFD